MTTVSRALRSGAARGRCTCTRGFTILEVLVVVALLAAISAIAFPTLSKWVGEYRFRETLEQFEASMESCRAATQRAGCAVRIAARTEGRRVRVLSTELKDRPPVREEAITDVREESPDFRVRFEFPAGFVAAGAGDRGTRAAEIKAAAGGAVLPDGAPPAEDLAILLPDGTASGGTTWRVRDSAGRLAEIVVDHWSGAVRLRRIAEPEPEPVPTGGAS